MIIYTALFDDYHNILPIPKQTIPTQNILITDKERNVDGWETVVVERNFSEARLENRYYKCLFHEDCSEDTIYVDSNLSIKPTFAEQYAGYLKGYDMALFQHPSSKTIEDEYVLASKLPKYDAKNMLKLMEYLRLMGQSENPVWACTTIARRGELMNNVLLGERWFNMNLISDMDQLSLAYLVDSLSIEVNTIRDKNFMHNDMYEVAAWRAD